MGQAEGFYQAGLVDSSTPSELELHDPISPKFVMNNEGDIGSEVHQEVEGGGPLEPVDEQEGDEREGGERRPVTRRAPNEPTNDEIQKHRLTHTPYRSWCPECVKGRAKMSPHRKLNADSEKAIPTVHVDYWFMRDRRGSELVAVATLKDDLTKTYKAHVVSNKGNVDGVADQIVKDLEMIGYGTKKIIIKCDQENALVDLVKEVARKRVGVETIIEHSRAKDSQSNSVAERAVQSVEGIVRTFKLALEKRLGVQIPSSHPMMAWVVEHSAEQLNRYHVSQDGRTAYERVRGKAYKGEMHELGIHVYHRFPGKCEGGSMEPRWSEGVWLGKVAKTDEHIVSDDSGRICRTGSVSLKTAGESWNAERVLAVRVFPNGLNEPRSSLRAATEARAEGIRQVPDVQSVREEDSRDGPDIADLEEREAPWTFTFDLRM